MRTLLSIGACICAASLTTFGPGMSASLAQGQRGANSFNPTAVLGEAGREPVGFLNFQGTPVTAVLEYYSRMVKRDFIAPGNLTQLIYFHSQASLTTEEAMQALETALAAQAQLAIIPMGEKFLKIVPLGGAKQDGVQFTKAREMPAADILVTQIVPIQHAEVNDLLPAIQPFMHPYGQLLALQKSNSILITETGNNINQMMEIIKAIDVPSPLRMETRVYTLQHAKAGEVAQRLQAIIQEAQQLGASATAPGVPAPPGARLPVPVPRPPTPGVAPSGSTPPAGESLIEGKVIITPDERTNKMFILSRPSNFDFFEKFITELDSKIEPDVIVKVIPLNYAKAEDAAAAINSLISGGSYTPTSARRSTTPGQTGRPAAPAPPPPSIPGLAGGAGTPGAGVLQYSEGVRILPDPRINSLLVMATREDIARIEDWVRKIDVPVAQVQIEVVIAEITLNNSLDVGVDVFKRLFDAGATTQTGGNITDGNAPAQLAPLSAIGSNLPTAAALAGGPGGLTWFTTFRNLKLDAVLHALASTSKAKILSTPVIQTLNNEQAVITVGESRPVPVSTVANLVGNFGTLSSSTAVNANIDYKDIAIELTVTPQINPGGYVRMDIQQKVNDLGGTVAISGTDAPIITKREAKSSVAVQDKSTIVLGGLIKENKTVTETKAPFFGDIPFFGQIFKSKRTNKTRDELIMFIRPTVMFTDEQAVAEARRRSRMLGAAEELGLERQFNSSSTNAPSSAPTSRSPQSADQAVEESPSLEDLRHAAKVKALQEQDGQSN